MFIKEYPSVSMGKYIMSRNIFQINLIHLAAVLISVAFIPSVFSDEVVTSDSLNYCLNGSYHKEKPSQESELYNQCSPWKDRSCCHFNTSFNAHHTNMYGFNYDHCSSKKNMSDSCRKHFRQDLCFYECSPNVGHWVVPVQMKTRTERFFEVPLCKSECDSWFKDCQDDYTCADDWIKKFTWTKNGNQCMNGSECLTFKEVFHNATDFCEKVWNHSWKVLPDNEKCMKIWFNGSSGNPNDEVAKYYVSIDRNSVGEIYEVNNDDNSVGKMYASVILISIILIPLFI